MIRLKQLFVVSAFAFALAAPNTDAKDIVGWLDWRGPNQNGTSMETGLVDNWVPGGENDLWSFPVKGQGTPVIANDRLYSFCYDGAGPDLQEFLLCLHKDTGEEIWRIGFNDFISDNVYDRYSIGSPTVDPHTGNIYLMTTPGLVNCVSPAGDILWQVSMMERFGRLTFPNGRTGAPVIEQDLVIVNAITSYWGADGPARNRFYAFDKHTGELVWSSTPGVGPKDSSFATPYFAWEGPRRVFYAGTGCGNIVCVNAHNGDPLWRFQMSQGGVNSSVVVFEDKVIAVHGKENVDSSDTGRMVAIKRGAVPKEGEAGPVVLDYDSEAWRFEDISMFTSSPVLVDGRVYQVDHTGELFCIDAATGKLHWKMKLANNQLHASPLYADGKLYIPMQDGVFYILKLRDDGADILAKVELEGKCIGSPALWDGKFYVHTTEKLYCFGSKDGGSAVTEIDPEEKVITADRVKSGLQITPSDVLLQPGDFQDFRYREMDQYGHVHPSSEYKEADGSHVEWSKFIPPTAKVKVTLDADFDDKGRLVALDDAGISAGMFKAKSKDGLEGVVRGRLLPNLPFSEDFESFELTETNPSLNVKFSYPPLPWIGARFKWEVWERDGNKVLGKTLDNVLFQRAVTFIGDPNLSGYTVEADVMTDGDRRWRSNVGVINQRYQIALIGNSQKLEVTSNYNRINVSVPFRWGIGEWYRLKTRVDVADDGSGVVRAKAWKKGDAEPDAWTIEVPHKIAHLEGTPGIFGFSPQSRYSVFVDNISVYPNE